MNKRVAAIEGELKQLTGGQGHAVNLPAQTAGLLKKFRERRNRLFPRLFGEPAWDMMLALMAQPDNRQAMSVTSVGHAADIPQTTALRHIALLEAAGLIERRRHPTDNRSTLVCLTATGRERMETLVERWPLALILVAIPILMILNNVA
ncbi:MarR family winged helix-turn-helix transcriptional regulator [Sphingomonas sp. CJ99]